MQQFDQRLRAQFAQLSPQEQRVAGFILDHFDDLISYNSAELSRLSGVSKATVSRLFKRMGYESYRQMRQELRELRQSGLPVADSRDAVQGNTLLARHYKQEMANLTRWVTLMDGNQFASVIQAMDNARRLCLIGLRNSYTVAMHLRQQLLQARGQVLLLPQPGQTLAEEIVDLTAEDMVVVAAFRRRPPQIRAVLQQLRQQQVPVLLISEPQAQALIGLARWHFATPLDSVSAFDSYSSAMSLVNLISNALLHHALAQGRQRIHAIAQGYGALGEIEQRNG